MCFESSSFQNPQPSWHHMTHVEVTNVESKGPVSLIKYWPVPPYTVIIYSKTHLDRFLGAGSRAATMA